jgi:Uma2 family endonuclease
VKRRLYAASAVPEYWIVDPVSRSIEVLRLTGATYGGAGWFTGDAVLVSPSFPGQEIPLRTVFRAPESASGP